jgi:MinD-like ATPase involved in chromosome partitioning or flagellar assembly
MKTITFYSYKGGVGRTLALSNIATRLAEFGKTVCMIDFDLEAPGIPYKFKKELKSLEFETGLVDYLQHYVKYRQAPPNVKDFITTVQEGTGKQKEITLLPAGNIYSKDYWVKLSSIGWDKFFYEKDSTGVEFFFDLKEKIKQEIQPDYLLIDSRTGISEIAGITLSLLADEVVLLSVNNEENLEGTQQVLRTVLQNNNPILGTPPKIHFVMSRMPQKKEGQAESPSYKIIQKVKYRLNQFLTEKELDYQIDKVLTIHSEPELQMEESLKIAYGDEDRPSAIGMDYLRLFQALTDGDLTEEEKKMFKRKRDFEKLKTIILNTKNKKKRIELLKKALGEFKELDELFIVESLGKAYYYEADYKNAKIYLDKTVKLNPDVFLHKLMLAHISYLSQDLESTLRLYNELDSKFPNNEFIIRSLGITYIENKEIKKGLIFFNRLINEFVPSYKNYNSYADALIQIGNYEKALKYIYEALELEPKEAVGNATLAEIQAYLGNDMEFYRNINMALSFGFTWKQIKKEPIYKKYLKEQRFIDMLARYDIYPEEEI